MNDSLLEDFVRAVEEAGLSDRVAYLRHGETYVFEAPAVRLGTGGDARITRFGGGHRARSD